MQNIPTIELNNGVIMPHIGLGTWKMDKGEVAENAVREALRIGYPLIDTASYYGNEESVGNAVRESEVAREEIFVTTKLWPTDFFNPEKAFETSFKKLGLPYIDLYLIHWPVPGMPKSIWRAMEKIAESNMVHAIGVSNYGIGDIEKLLTYATIPPAVNQIKFSPFDFAEEVLMCCRANNIIIEAYSPLTRGGQLHHPSIVHIAEKYQKTPAQIMIRWCIEHGTVPIPKSRHRERMRENIDVFDFTLDESDMMTLNDLS